VGAVNGRAAASRDSQPVPAAAERHALRTMIIDMVRQVRVQAHPPYWCCGAWVTLTAFL